MSRNPTSFLSDMPPSDSDKNLSDCPPSSNVSFPTNSHSPSNPDPSSNARKSSQDFRDSSNSSTPTHNGSSHKGHPFLATRAQTHKCEFSTVSNQLNYDHPSSNPETNYILRKFKSTEVETNNEPVSPAGLRRREFISSKGGFTPLQTITEKAETPRNDSSDVTECPSPESNYQDLRKTDPTLMEKWDESDRTSQGKLSVTTTPIPIKGFLPPSYSPNRPANLSQLQNFPKTLIPNCNQPKSATLNPTSKRKIDPLMVPMGLNSSSTTQATATTINNNQDFDLDISSTPFMINRSSSENNIPSFGSRSNMSSKEHMPFAFPKISAASGGFNFSCDDTKLTIMPKEHTVSKQNSKAKVLFGDSDDENDAPKPMPTRIIPVVANISLPMPNTKDIFQQSKTNKPFEPSKPPMPSFIVSKLANSFGVGSSFSVNPALQVKKGSNFTSTSTMVERSVSDTNIPKLIQKNKNISSNAIPKPPLKITDTASKVLDFEDDNDNNSRIKYNRPKAQGECSSAMLKTYSNMFASYGEEEQKLETKPEKKQNVERCQSENFLPSFNHRRFMNGDDELLSSCTVPRILDFESDESFDVEPESKSGKTDSQLIQKDGESPQDQSIDLGGKESNGVHKHDFRPPSFSKFYQNPNKVKRSQTETFESSQKTEFRSNSLHENGEGKGLNSRKLRINKDYVMLGNLDREKKYVSTYLYESRNDKELYAIKCVDNITDREQVYQLLNEIQGNNYSGSEDAKQFLVKYYNAWIEEEKLYIVMEYCNYNLYSLGRRQYQVVEEETVKNLLRDICTPLKDLHQNKLFHLKIKPENILVSKNNRYKIADLGLSKLLYQMKTANLDNLGMDIEEDFTYFAPELLSEVFSDKPLDLTKSDIFSLGISVYEFLLGLDLRNNRQAQADIKNGNFEVLERSNYSDSLKNTLKSMLDQDPTKRPSAEQLLNGFLETNAQKAAKEQKNNNNRLREEIEGLKEKLGIKRKKSL